MPDTITFEVPADAPERDLRRVRQEVEVARRRAQIREAYPDLRDEYGRDEAMRRLKERHDCSRREVRFAVYGG
jgi:hypothetical protein